MKNFLSKTWVKGVIIFIPFTGIISPVWYVFLVFAYFIGGIIYLNKYA